MTMTAPDLDPMTHTDDEVLDVAWVPLGTPHDEEPALADDASDLGNLGRIPDAAVAAAAVTFGYFGSLIRMNWRLTDADVLDFIELATRLDTKDPKSMVALKDAFRQAVDPRDFDAFWGLAIENAQSLEDRMAVLSALYAAIASRPTRRSTDSSGGPSTTPPSSAAASSSAASRSRTGRRQELRSRRQRALGLLAGRPDLQLMVADAPAPAESRHSAQS